MASEAPDDPDVAALAAEYPAWRVWRKDDLVFAWLPESGEPYPLLLYDATVAGLRAKVAAHEKGKA
jgi:hypothetical protein